MAFFRSCLFALGYFVLTISYGTLSALTWLLPPLTRHRLVCSWTTAVIVWLRIACGVRYKISGLEHVASTAQPFVVLAKHSSAWETLYLQSLFWPASTVLKKELLRIPFFGWGLMALQPIAIDRSNPRLALRQVKEKGLRRIKRGLNVILFPEGTRMRLGERGTYARSGADIAKSSEVSIIPVAHDAAKCWPSKSFIKYPGCIDLRIGPAISTADKNNKQIMAEVENWIEDQMIQIQSQKS